MEFLLDAFEWDSNKDEANKEKHGISFEDAIELFDAPYLRFRSDRCGEIRWIALGKAQRRVIAVIYTERGGRIRIVSARMARTKEREIHQRIGDTS
jgi:uncharacterized DUF497 family protein